VKLLFNPLPYPEKRVVLIARGVVNRSAELTETCGENW